MNSATIYQLSGINKTSFLAEYWQKKPLVIKHAFVNFKDPIDEHELAGLAQEEGIDSRIVSCNKAHWNVSHGPFDSFEEICIGSWSLLVQAVDHHIPEADALMRAFDFIPHWRMDDLMVSFSNIGAGVGPHLDQYDVFIVQGKGSRRWQVGMPSEYLEHFPHDDLRQIDGFTPIIDEVLEPGDVIYIPPGFPHNGVALQDCMNFSVGFRAASQQEMLSSIADYALENDFFNVRYRDPEIKERDFSGEIKQQEINEFKLQLQQVLDSDHFPNWLGKFLSRSQEVYDLENENIEQYDPIEIQIKIEENSNFIRSPALKPVLIGVGLEGKSGHVLYVGDQEFRIPPTEAKLIKSFVSAPNWNKKDDKYDQNSMFFTQFVTTLVNSGYWYLE
jgi:50S ribosomal protein L16 3-hydroxylase